LNLNAIGEKMLVHSLKMTLRSLTRARLYSLINITGFAVAIASCLILGVYLYSELSYDRHHLQHERIYRIANAYEDYDTGNQRREVAVTSTVLGGMLARDFPEIEAFVRLRPFDDDVMIRNKERTFHWDKAFYADANVFTVFTHEVIYGDPATALVDPSSVAVSRSFAKFYFDDADPIGEVITLTDGGPRTITLVFEDLPENTHLRYDVLFLQPS
jgi:putative ABC transport system permease protein